MPYREARTWRFTLEEIGCPELYVTCLSPEDVPAGEQLRMAKAWAILRRANRTQELSEDEEWALEAADDFLRLVIVDWNLVYPPRHPKAGTVIPLDNAKINPFAPLPTYVYQEIVRKVMGGIAAPPKSAA
jgi:hypothetical protein